MLDSKDQELLFALDFRARDDIKDISKSLSIGPTEAERRIKKLIESDVILGFQPVIDVPRLGYYCCRLMISLFRYGRDDKADIIDFLINHSGVYWVAEVHGEYDLMICLWLPSITKFKDFNDDLNGRFGYFIKRKRESIVTDYSIFQSRYLSQTPSSREIRIGEPTEKHSLTKAEERVLKLLSLNARTSDEELATSLKTSQPEAAAVVAQLEDQSIIRGYRPIINNRLLGFGWYKIWLNVHRTPHKTYREMIDYISSRYRTIWLLEGVGILGDIEIEIMAESSTALYDYIDDLRLRFPSTIEEHQFFRFERDIKKFHLPFY